MVQRLADEGIPPGVEIEVPNRKENGSVILGRSGGSLSIGAGMSRRIVVSSIPPESEPELPIRGKRVWGKSRSRRCQSSEQPGLRRLGGLKVGQSRRILRYGQGCRAYRSKLLFSR
jgi:hypothetical protein